MLPRTIVCLLFVLASSANYVHSAPSTVPPTVPPTAPLTCGPDTEWILRDGFCYWSSSFNHGKDRMNSWFGAEIECRKKQADLVSIHSESENTFVHKKTHCAQTWTGLTVVDTTKRTKPEGLLWIDGSPRTYLNWYSGMPGGDSYERHNCYYQHASTGGKWYHGLCSLHRKYYVCKKKAIPKASASVMDHILEKRLTSSCDPGWKLAGSNCLHVNNTQVDFFEALLQCQRLNSHLATLHSAHEEAVLSNVFDSCDTPWIGLENVDPNRVNSNKGWRWNDDSIVDYTNWKDVLPTNDKTKQCGRIERGLSWINTQCWNFHPFVCQKTANA